MAIRVLPLAGSFPDDYLRPDGGPVGDIGRGVSYSNRSEHLVNGRPAVRARFSSSGPTPNWGIEWAVANEDRILDAYVSRPSPAVEAEFDRVIETLEL